MLITLFQILVPLVEKVAEHLTAIDEAHDNQVSNPLDLRITNDLTPSDEFCAGARPRGYNPDSPLQLVAHSHHWLGHLKGHGRFNPAVTVTTYSHA